MLMGWIMDLLLNTLHTSCTANRYNYWQRSRNFQCVRNSSSNPLPDPMGFDNSHPIQPQLMVLRSNHSGLILSEAIMSYCWHRLKVVWLLLCYKKVLI